MPRVALEDSSAIVTGGASGIGEACARQLADAGSKVVIADLNEARGSAVAEELGGRFVKCDVTNINDVDAAIAAAIEMAPLRAVVNSAGIGNPGRTIDRENAPLPLEKFTFVIQVNLIGTFNMLSRAAAAMAKCEPMDADGARGCIVNMASAAAFDGQIGQASYSASKGGVVQLSKSLATAWAKDDIQVNCFLPGWIDTPLTQGLRAQVEGVSDKVLARTPADRWGHIDDFQGLAVFLSSAASDFITGAVIPVDGGFSASLL